MLLLFVSRDITLYRQHFEWSNYTPLTHMNVAYGCELCWYLGGNENQQKMMYLFRLVAKKLIMHIFLTKNQIYRLYAVSHCFRGTLHDIYRLFPYTNKINAGVQWDFLYFFDDLLLLVIFWMCYPYGGYCI